MKARPTIFKYKGGILYLNCEHELHPKSIDLNDSLAPCPVAIADSCDNWSPKNDYVKYVNEIPRVCFNCFHSVALELKKEDLE